MMKRNKNLLMATTVAIMAILLSSVPANAITTNKILDIQTGKPVIKSEKIIDIGNEIKLYSKEMGKGYATVVFETGYGNDSESWGTLQEEISRYTRTISYDRAGLGKSSDVGNLEPLNEKDFNTLLNGGTIPYNENNFIGTTKTARDKAINLYKLLKASNIPAPYILVNHSIGGHTAIEFAKLYGNELAGVVFLDSSARKVVGEGYEFYKKYLPEFQDMYLNQFSKEDGTIDELLMGQAQVLDDRNALRDIPILYLESDAKMNVPGDEVLQKAWVELRKGQVDDILSLSNYSEYKLIEGAGHYVHLDKPIVVKNAVMNFVQEVEYMK